MYNTPLIFRKNWWKLEIGKSLDKRGKRKYTENVSRISVLNILSPVFIDQINN